ncbi:MAG: ketopantoate reductase family protein [Kofleriaceae bacterium]|nr:ketopantoate reductase family protein [Kofleriaceae bacterium]MCB9575295.1 ketopantoate reductase family protein [Kofleriaceae bacterium]
MRYIVLGAGAVGGALGVRLVLAERDVVLVARGAHGDAIRARGLTLRTPSREDTVRPPCVARLGDVGLDADDVVLLAVKAQDAAGALVGAEAAASVVCLQNGVATEPLAATRAARVHAAMTWIPGVHLEPGVVEVHADPPLGAFRIGRYPDGPGAADELAHAIAYDLTTAGFDAAAVPDPMRWKRGKLLTNLGNVLDAFAVREPGLGELARAASAEAVAVFTAAGLSYVPYDELLADMNARVAFGATIDGRGRGGGSTWQSATRGRSTEIDELNGWVCRRGAELGVPTPVNAALVRLAAAATAPRSVPIAQIRADIEAATAGA